ncbi:MAG: histidinol-phosphatase HisJ family protein [Faecousia sp.]
MFDYHIHSRVSFDGHDTGLSLAQAARDAGLREICFTDHRDYDPGAQVQTMLFDPRDYSREYDSLEIPGLKVRRGMEFGMTPDNRGQFQEDLKLRAFDFVLGSVHFVEGQDVYFAPYWQGKTQFQAERRYLEETLRCVTVHDDFDVLAHLNFLSKSPASPHPRPLSYGEHAEIVDAILETLVKKGKGLEMNTSGIDRGVGFLPEREFFVRFRELGGKIVTIGSDAHRRARVGQYTAYACEILSDIFGHVCTFENRQPIFHKI